MWPYQYSGHTAAEFPMTIHGGGGISASLLQPPRNQWAELVDKMAPLLKDYLEKKKNDEIANQLMNMEQPPRAEAVNPSIQGAPASAPATSGVRGYKMQQMYQDFLNNQPDTATDDLNYQILWNKAHPDQSPDETGMTPYQREQTRLREMDIQRKMDKDQGQLPPGVSREVYNASKRQNFDAAQAFRDMQQSQPAPVTNMPEAGSTPSIKSQAEYSALPSGTIYIAPDGTKRRKP